MPAPDEFTLLCERCGYEIESLPREEECPECGKPIAESLPERRTGTPWQHEQSWSTVLRTGWLTIRSPLRTLDLMYPDIELATRQIDRLSMLTGAIAAVPAALWLILELQLIGLLLSPVVFLGVTLCTILAVKVLTAIEARGIQFFAARRSGRLSPAMAWTICSHGAVGWLIAAVGISIGAIIALFMTYAALDRGPTAPLPPGAIPFRPRITTTASAGSTLALLGFLAGFLFFETFAWLGVRRCKFANRARAHPKSNETA